MEKTHQETKDQLRQDIEDFLARGGKIQQVPAGKMTAPQKEWGRYGPISGYENEES